MAEPIWKDFLVNLGAPATSGAGVPFFIYCTPKSATIFEGVAYPKPGENNAIIRINDICANYISHYFLEQPNPTMPAQANFKVYRGRWDASTLKASVDFYNDWSYELLYNPAADGMNFPVVLTFGERQLILLSLISGSPSDATIYMENGQVYTYTPVQVQGGDFNNDYNEDFLTDLQYFGDTYVVPMADFPGAVRVELAGRTYIKSGYCPQYVLYYLNCYGGWDALPVEGRTVKEDSVTRYTTEKVYNNADPSARGKMNFLNDIKRTYQFNTGWLNAQQSSRMHNLLNSPSVYVHDMETDFIMPLVLTPSTTEYKEQRGVLHSYMIEAELAQERIRR